MRILIAEDEFITRMTLQVCLENWGYRVKSVADGKEAWAMLQNSSAPHIAILDWEMPELDGIEVCRLVKEKVVESPPYIILLTGRDSEIDIVRGFDAGADDYMTKPFNDNELRARVRVAERLVRTQASLAESVAELRAALNQLELVESGVDICGQCRKIFSSYDGQWHSFEEVMGNGADPRFIVNSCPDCYKG